MGQVHFNMVRCTEREGREGGHDSGQKELKESLLWRRKGAHCQDTLQSAGALCLPVVPRGAGTWRGAGAWRVSDGMNSRFCPRLGPAAELEAREGSLDGSQGLLKVDDLQTKLGIGRCLSLELDVHR